jgi:hypothetical protein
MTSGDSRAHPIDLDAPRRSLRISAAGISTEAARISAEAVGKRAEGVKVESREEARLLRPRRLQVAP